jgi:sugar phosphate isomerase/epimerase
MFKNLSPSAIGVFGGQSELLEIALTHRFKGLEIDIGEILRRVQATSVSQACRYFRSASIAICGFELPVRWNASDNDFQADLDKMGPLLEVCTTVGADRCFTTVAPTSDQRPFHENFQFHVERLRQMADVLSPANVRLALNFLAGPSDRGDGDFQFIYQAEPTILLINAIQKDNVGLLLDTWHWHVGGGDLEKLHGLRGDQILSVRLADIPADADAANITNEQRLMPGEGSTIDSRALLSALDDMGFDGPVAVAPAPTIFKGQTRESIVTKASAALDALLAGVASEKPVGALGQ